MDEKIKLLMEETMCDQGEAELALELSKYDLEVAIRTIRNLLRNIEVIKGKFIINNENLYGIFIIIVNKRSENIIRIRTVVSYNPVIYEINLNLDWDYIERMIYSYRLQEGSVLFYGQNVEKYFNNQIIENEKLFFSIIKTSDTNKENKIREILLNQSSGNNQSFTSDNAEIQIAVEELNLAQYQQEIPFNKITKTEQEYDTKVELEVKLYEDETGRKIKDLRKGDVVLAQIVDTREIAKYLLKLLGIKENQYLPVSIESIEIKDKEAFLEVFISFGISGKYRVPANKSLKVEEKSESSWWKKLLRLK